MANVVPSIPELEVTKKGWEKNKEVYVVSFLSDDKFVDKFLN